MSNILVSKGPVTVITLNRPEVRNALNTATILELLEVLGEVGADDGVEVVILTAAGDRAFCAGADLGEVHALAGEAAVRQYFGNMARLIATLQHLPQPTIAAVFGFVLAGGMGLAAGVDLLVAADDTQFGLPEVKVGLYPMVVTAPIARLIGARRALELGLTGRLLTVAEASQWGFLNRVVPAGTALDGAVALAEEIRVGSPLIARWGKEGWRLSRDMGMDDAMESLKNLVALVALSDDSRAGVSAFLNKERPQWPSRHR